MKEEEPIAVEGRFVSHQEVPVQGIKWTRLITDPFLKSVGARATIVRHLVDVLRA
jgi:hypothetical protein